MNLNKETSLVSIYLIWITLVMVMGIVAMEIYGEIYLSLAIILICPFIIGGIAYWIKEKKKN